MAKNMFTMFGLRERYFFWGRGSRLNPWISTVATVQIKVQIATGSVPTFGGYVIVLWQQALWLGVDPLVWRFGWRAVAACWNLSHSSRLDTPITEHLAVSSVQSCYTMVRIWNEDSSIALRNVPSIWAWQMQSIVIWKVKFFGGGKWQIGSPKM